MDFVYEMQFDRVGVFTYSYEADTPSGAMPQVAEEVKEARRDLLMQKQQQISLMRNQRQVGKTLTTLIEGHDKGLSFGRTYRDAPEVDGLVIVDGQLPVGDFAVIRITGMSRVAVTALMRRHRS